MRKRRVIIMGAAGRDFHNFNVLFRDDPDYEVVAFTAAQIPNIDDRRYPAALAGPRYPEGIPVYPEEDLTELVRRFEVDEVVFAYSDVSHVHVMHRASEAMAAGASFVLLGPRDTMIRSQKPVVAVCAVRTGCGKSQTTRKVTDILRAAGARVVVVRHPMPYGDLVSQRVQRFASLEDLDRYGCTIEEREEYEPHIRRGNVVYAGVDYGEILRQAEAEADVIVWDGGNNDFPFYQPDLHIVVADPHRAGHELAYYPGEVNLRMADVVVINKEDTASWENIEKVRENVLSVNPRARIIDAASPIFVEDPKVVRGKRVLVVEDGPTLTHGEMGYGAGTVAARRFGAAELVDPRPYLVGSLKETLTTYPHLGKVLPAMGYGAQQIRELEETIALTPAEAVVIATPVDLRRLFKIEKPSTRVYYELQEIGQPTLEEVLQPILDRLGIH
ncbi:MAG: cyclic 2,3-diphosphoglycerate synthase [candidate division KSB1 bacterium]|nr:cyclic 2,3-diphosphoglycerate synthase [candidate division KSB1 bacterium]